jgi:hypothetical protein
LRFFKPQAFFITLYYDIQCGQSLNGSTTCESHIQW